MEKENQYVTIWSVKGSKRTILISPIILKNLFSNIKFNYPLLKLDLNRRSRRNMIPLAKTSIALAKFLHAIDH